MKDDIIGDKFTAVGRRQVLPVNTLADMNHKSIVVGKFPAFGQVAFDAAIGTLTNTVIVDRRVHRPVVDEHFFQPCRVNLGEVHAVPGVKISRFPVEADSEFAPVLRCAEFIPPVTGRCYIVLHSHSLE